MFASLMPDLVGIDAGPAAAVPIAARAGFAVLNLRINRFVYTIERIGEDALRDAMEAAGLRAGYCSMTAQKMNVADEAWHAEMHDLKRRAEVARTLGFSRATSVVVPFDEDLEPSANTARHAERARAVADVLGDYGIRFGLEYVSPRTRWEGKPNRFVHNLDGMLSLLEAIDRPGVGVMLDCFHWHCAGETPADLRRLRADQIIAVHVNDLVAGRPVEEQTVMERELPGVSGVIDMDGFLGTIAELGYDGPISAEPTHPRWKQTSDEVAARQTADAIHRCLRRAGAGAMAERAGGDQR
ncbi:MAG: sugar phosphate isomerase/epimerase [Planctomycetota bacterium]